MHQMWVEKYRPKKLDDYVWINEQQKKQVERLLREKVLPHMLLSGHQGAGKTTLAKLMFHELEVPQGDILEINASKENSVDTIRTKVSNFASMSPISFETHAMRYVLLDEADALTPNAQMVLRNDMETYSSNARFILTCNYENKIIPALKSRCQGYHFQNLDMEQFIVRVGEILTLEKVEFEFDILESFVRSSYPDLRACINKVEQNSYNGILERPSGQDQSTSDYMLEMVDLFKQNEFLKARKLIVAQARPEDYENIYRFLYKNLELWGDTEEKQDHALHVIRQGIVDHGIAFDAEMILADVIVRLKEVSEGKI